MQRDIPIQSLNQLGEQFGRREISLGKYSRLSHSVSAIWRVKKNRNIKR